MLGMSRETVSEVPPVIWIVDGPVEVVRCWEVCVGEGAGVFVLAVDDVAGGGLLLLLLVLVLGFGFCAAAVAENTETPAKAASRSERFSETRDDLMAAVGDGVRDGKYRRREARDGQAPFCAIWCRRRRTRNQGLDRGTAVVQHKMVL